MSNIKELVRNYLPYAYVTKRNRAYEAEERVALNINSKDTIPQEELRFDNLVTTMGFGYSGHSAVLDLLKEYPQDLELGDKYYRHFECDMARHAGGIFEIEKYLDSSNVFQNDALLHRVIKLFSYVRILKHNEQAKRLTDAYVSSLIDFKIDGINQVAYNPHLQRSDDFNKEILYLKKRTLDEFRSLSRNYLYALFNCFAEEGKSNLILNHLFTDGEFNMDKLNAYLPGIKVIVIYRDPRDVFAQAVKNQVKWIPTNDINQFVHWYKYSISNFDLNRNDYLVVSFENLIYHYEREKARIEDFIGINPSTHTDKNKFLIPQNSMKNIGLWKSMTNIAEEIKIIEREFGEFVFEG